jgi:hypothetical protein
MSHRSTRRRVHPPKRFEGTVRWALAEIMSEAPDEPTDHQLIATAVLALLAAVDGGTELGNGVRVAVEALTRIGALFPAAEASP